MALVSFFVLDGQEGGTIIQDVPTPLTVGREEGNTILLNDDRVSRVHLKLQDDHGQVVLTDLDSTNGTLVNGESVRVSLLRPGDQIRVGSTLLVYGTVPEILQRIGLGDGLEAENARLSASEDPAGVTRPPNRISRILETLLGKGERTGPGEKPAPPWCEDVPQLPQQLTPAQVAQVNELLVMLHRRLRVVIDSMRVDGSKGEIRASLEAWQRVLSLEMDLAKLMRSLVEPPPPG